MSARMLTTIGHGVQQPKSMKVYGENAQVTHSNITSYSIEREINFLLCSVCSMLSYPAINIPKNFRIWNQFILTSIV